MKTSTAISLAALALVLGIKLGYALHAEILTIRLTPPTPHGSAGAGVHQRGIAI